ncbi:4050_t:CDS:1 [Paraglomus occultum]|uniref:4050_t:CDS:1 n=1 Tax=Paraglomus occultum TaxID=144539 RepID=A0A9N9FKG3_9GLOM|nr:4050_t:CDS:1 [Paraglomus occultum]
MPPKSRTRRRNSDASYSLPSESDSSSDSENSISVSTSRRRNSPSPSRQQNASSKRSSNASSKRSSNASSRASSVSPTRNKNKSTSASSSRQQKQTNRRKSKRKNAVVTNANDKTLVIPKIVVRNPTKKAVVIQKKQPQPQPQTETGLLTPPKARRKRNQKKELGKDEKENSNPEDDILATLPLPSSSIRHIYNENVSMIGAINIQAFGTKKASNRTLMRIISDILRRYDIVLCQEIHAPKDDDAVIRTLVSSVSTPSTPYAYVASRPIGRGRYRERYVYLYRTNVWRVLDEYVVDDDTKLGDKFARDPYVVRFEHVKKSNTRVTLVGCHTQPENALIEIKALIENVYSEVKNNLKDAVRKEKVMTKRYKRAAESVDKDEKVSFFRRLFACCFPIVSTSSSTSREARMSLLSSTEPIIMMGDLNAAGSYVNKAQRTELDQLLQDHGLVWGIPHTTDTTVSDGSDSAYDRFIFERENEKRWIGNSGTWRFDEGWLKTSTDQLLIKKLAKKVSDHYPIEFEFRL